MINVNNSKISVL